MADAPPTGAPDTRLFYDAFHASPIGIAVENLEGQPLFVNPAFCSMLGFSEEEMRHKHCVEFSPPEDAERDWLLFQQLRAGLIDHYQLDKRYFRRDGSLVWGRLTISLLNSRPDPLVIAMVEDITDRKQAEQALRESQEGLRFALEAGSAGRWDWEIKNGGNREVGEAQALLGLAGGESLGSGQEFWDRVHSEDRGRLKDAFRKAKQDHTVFIEEFRVVWPDQSIHWLRCRGKYYYGSDGVPERVSGIARDITERKAAEEALRKSEEKFSKAFRQSPLAITLTRVSDHRFLDVNATFEQLTGWHRDEVVGRLVPEIGIWADSAQSTEFLEEVLAEGALRDWEIRYRRKDGVERVGLGSAELIEIANETCILFVLADITDRKRTEEALRGSEERLREYERAVEGAEEMIAVVDRDYRYLIANRRFLAMRNLTTEQVVGRSAPDVVHPEVFEGIVRKKLDECFQGNVVRYELKYKYPELGERDLLVSYFPIEGANGIDRVACIFQDITDRKQAEEALATMSRKMIEAQEQERTRIARELHDDITQRLALLAVEMDATRQNPPSSIEETSRLLTDLRDRIAEVSSQVQSISHQLHSSQLEYLGIVAAMRSLCRDFAARQKVEINFTHEGIPEPITRDVSLCLFRVLQEALHNALKHSNVRYFEVRLGYADNQLQLTVSDRGTGFDIQSAINKAGLGLISMRERVRLAKGTIAIESKPMGGTTIHARVPIDAARLSEQKAS